jgi:hypothetical protein
MASVSTDRYGTRILQFTARDGVRRTIRLGKMPMKDARDVARRVDALNLATIAAQPIEREMAEWLGSIGDKLHAKFAAAGLAAPRASINPGSAVLGSFLDEFIAKRAGTKESTLSSIRLAAKRLTSYFGPDTRLDAITPGQADDWLTWMKVYKKYAGATTGRTVKHPKRFFRSAVRLGLLSENPFADLKSQKQTNDERKFFVTQETACKVLARIIHQPNRE